MKKRTISVENSPLVNWECGPALDLRFAVVTVATCSAAQPSTSRSSCPKLSGTGLHTVEAHLLAFEPADNSPRLSYRFDELFLDIGSGPWANHRVDRHCTSSLGGRLWAPDPQDMTKIQFF